MLRIIKEDRVLELWKLNKEGEYIKAKTYEICAVSGTLGPKKKQGDRQGPEGFYEITSSSLNPSSVEYLSFDTGYPNARDRAHNYSGSALMVHGGCSSAGCYAITDPSMDEVYSAVRDALAGGQRSVQLQIYPFRMTAWRMLAEKKNPNYEFWKELKAGWDKFEQTTRPLIVDVKGGRYVIR
jgi:murein L,D-transpeptidase YafK